MPKIKLSDKQCDKITYDSLCKSVDLVAYYVECIRSTGNYDEERKTRALEENVKLLAALTEARNYYAPWSED